MRSSSLVYRYIHQLARLPIRFRLPQRQCDPSKPICFFFPTIFTAYLARLPPSQTTPFTKVLALPFASFSLPIFPTSISISHATALSLLDLFLHVVSPGLASHVLKPVCISLLPNSETANRTVETTGTEPFCCSFRRLCGLLAHSWIHKSSVGYRPTLPSPRRARVLLAASNLGGFGA